MKLTKRQAKALSIKKWEYIVGNDGSGDSLLNRYPELKKLNDYCGYCEKYKMLKEIYPCIKCPINFGLNVRYDCSCITISHPYNKWYNEPTKANAQVVLDLIRES